MFAHGGGMAFGGIFMWVFWLILLVPVVVIIRAIIIAITTSRGSKQSLEENPLDILRKH